MAVYTRRKVLLEKIDLIFKEMKDIRQSLLRTEPRGKKDNQETWNNLMKLSDEISAKWQGPSAVEEVRHQRNKGYR